MYVLKTDEWKDQGFPKGSIFPNPFYRWFAPVTLDDQVKEHFPSTLSDHNTTHRASAFTDYGAEFSFPWEQVSSSPARPSMQEVVSVAIQNNNWLEFCTMNDKVGVALGVSRMHTTSSIITLAERRKVAFKDQENKLQTLERMK